MARKQHAVTSMDRWARDMALADETIGASSKLNPDEKERILLVIRALGASGEKFYQTWQGMVASLEEGTDGLSISPFARQVLQMDALRIWAEPNPVVREKIFDSLRDASVPKPRQTQRKENSVGAASLAGKTVPAPEW